jgi:glutamate racemase
VNTGKIGVFDSGVGGLTVVRALNKLLPEESVVYFGDTARVPYGSKSPETVIRFSMEDAEFLIGKGVKLLVVACNTASSVSLPALREFAEVPVTGVIIPGAKAAAEVTESGAVGVIGTLGTISSGAYQKALKSYDSVTRVIAQPTPLLVPLVEEGWLDHRITEIVLREYTAPLVSECIDTLVLGCTHYPLLKNALSKVLGEGIQLVDSAESTAVEVASILNDRNIRSNQIHGENSFYVSDIPLKFQEIAQRFLGKAVPLVTHIEVGKPH